MVIKYGLEQKIIGKTVKCQKIVMNVVFKFIIIFPISDYILDYINYYFSKRGFPFSGSPALLEGVPLQ